MIGNKEFLGLVLDNKSLDLAKIRVSGKRIVLENLERRDLISPLDEGYDSRQHTLTDSSEENPDDIFGLDEAEPEPEGDIEEFDFDDLDDIGDIDDLKISDEEDEPDSRDLDLVDEADLPESNEMLLYSSIQSTGKGKRKYIGLNIRSGNTVFQFATDTNYSTVKKKEIKDLVRSKLQALHGHVPDADRYNYSVEKDGKLSIASVDREPESLRLLNKIHEISTRSSIFVKDVIPDEIALIGLYRWNYPPGGNESSITGLVQFRESRCRVLFFRGHELLQVSPVINEGTGNKSFLNTVFSKLLFQLDTGEVPGLDRLILCDNTLGRPAIDFFEENFPDVAVSEFRLNPDLFEIDENIALSVSEFTTAIAIATGASGIAAGHYPDLSLIPQYIHERQKVFKLQWHGVILLIAIGLTPVVLNHFYQENIAVTEQLTTENLRYDVLITELEQTVQQTEMMEEMLAIYQEQLLLLNELSEDNIRLTVSFDHFNQAVEEVGGLWITTFREASGGLHVEGISLGERQIPSLARQFANVTLLNVRKDETRERSIFLFSMRINRVVTDENLYTPEESRRIVDFLESF